MDITYYLVSVLAFATLTSTSIVKWLPSSSFNLPVNFKDGKLPCSKKTVVFPQTMTGSIGLESIMDIGALILPKDGEIVLENAVIGLGTVVGDDNCTEGNSYYLDKSISSWTQAGVWSSSRFTEATPDSERLPCYDDVVVFPKNVQYTVRLPNEQQNVRSLSIGNTSYTTSSFLEYVQSQSDQMEQFILNELLQSGVTVLERSAACQQSFGCPCQNNPPTIDCTVKFCPKPSCVAPIKPVGYCCSFCGGFVTFDIDEGFDMISFKELVEKIVDGYRNTVVYHIGFTSITPNRKILLVIVDKGEYIGDSAEAISRINNEVHSHWYKGEKLLQISGSPLSKRGLGVKLFVSMFFAVVLVMGAIYFYYYRLPTVTFPVGGNVARSRGMFSRFQNRSDSVVSLTRRDSTVLPAARTAFRNPLYDSKRGRVQVAESAVEES